MERVKKVNMANNFIYLYEDRTLKPVKIILCRSEGDEGE
jgi:hypothetical protein